MRTNATRCAVLACFMACSGAALAGNMSLEIDGVPAVQVSAFTGGASNTLTVGGAGGGAGAGKAVFQDFSFKATQSAASPVLLKFVAQGKHAPGAKLQVRTTDGTRLVSEWTLTDVFVTSLNVANGDLDPKAKAGDIYLTPETSFSLAFGKVCYRVFGADGTTVAGETCWDIARNEGS